jgi:tetratricopeptide (TPR) repeat protein
MSEAVIERERLTWRLIAAARYPATIVYAREGYGKTTAIRRYLTKQSVPALELGLLPEHRTLAAFARALAEMLEPIAPGLRASYARAIEFAQQAEHPQEELAIWFLGHLTETRERCIFVDDLHHAEDERIFDLIERLLNGSSSRCRWIFATRTLPSVARRWREAKLCGTPIDEEELRLTEYEMQELAVLNALSEPQATSLFQMTGGWPLAVTIGSKLPQWILRLKALNPNNTEGVYSFLAEQLFLQFDEPLQELLLKCCVFTTVSEDAIAESPWRAKWSEAVSLAREGQLLSLRYDGSIGYHDLFRRFLESRLAQREDAGIENACAFAASLLERCGHTAEALQLYVRARSDANILRLCERCGFELMDEGRLDEVQQALATIDPQIAARNAMALAVKAIAESNASRTDIAESWYLQAIEWAETSSLKAHVAYRYGLDLIRNGRLDGIEPLERHLSDRLPLDLDAELRSTLAVAYVRAQRFDDATAMIASAVSLLERSASERLHAKVYHHAAWVGLHTGEIMLAKGYASRAVDLAVKCGMYEIAARAYSVLYNISYDIEDNPRTTIAILNSILDCGLKAGNAAVRLYALLGNIDVCAEMGDIEGVAATEKLLETHGVIYADQATSESLLPAEALTLAGHGKFAEAYDITFPTGERQTSPDRQALRFSEIAFYAAAGGLRAEAEAALVNVRTKLLECDASARRTIRTQLNRALAVRILDRPGEASAILDHLAECERAMSPRLKALYACVDAVFRRWDGEENYDEVYSTLCALRAADFGGIAAVIAALPRGQKAVVHA